MQFYCPDISETWLNAAKIQFIMNFKNSKSHILSASQPAFQPAVRPSCARCMAPEFLNS